MTIFNIIVDGSNIAFFRRNNDKKAMFYNLEIIIRYLNELKTQFPVNFLIVVDASLYHNIDDISKYNEAYGRGEIVQCPSGNPADIFILEYAHKHRENTVIISNDNFSEYDTSGLTLCKFAIIFGEIIIKPNLEEVFNSNSIKHKKEVIYA